MKPQKTDLNFHCSSNHSTGANKSSSPTGASVRPSM